MYTWNTNIYTKMCPLQKIFPYIDSLISNNFCLHIVYDQPNMPKSALRDDFPYIQIPYIRILLYL